MSLAVVGEGQQFKILSGAEVEDVLRVAFPEAMEVDQP